VDRKLNTGRRFAETWHLNQRRRVELPQSAAQLTADDYFRDFLAAFGNGLKSELGTVGGRTAPNPSYHHLYLF